MSKRIDLIDAAKGIGILLVVLGHNRIKFDVPVVYQVIYSFHMPFFFLLSGLLFKPDYGFWELVRRRLRGLVLPFISTLLVLYATSLLYSDMGIPTLLRRVGKALYAGTNSLDWTPLWFLPHLFLVNLFAFLIFHLLYKRIPWLWARILFLVGLLGLGVAGIKLFWPFEFSLWGMAFRFDGLPWSADLLPITTAFFLTGFEMRRSLPEKWYGAWWLGAGALVIFAGLNWFFPYTLDFYIRKYDSFPVVTLEALTGSLLVLWLARWLELHGKVVFRGLQYLGAASIVLLIFHYIPQAYFYEKLVAWQVNAALSNLLSFLVGVLVPIVLYAWVLRPNPRLGAWFGLGQPER